MDKIKRLASGWRPDATEVGPRRRWNGNDWTASPGMSRRHMPQNKNAVVAFLLTFFFGPFGLFYVSVPLALGAVAVAFVVLPETVGFSFLLTWPVSIILGCTIASRRHSDYQAWLIELRTGTAAPSPSTRSPWPAAAGVPPQWRTPTVAEPYVTLGGSPGAAQVNGPPGWRPDPTGRFEVRWWNGTTWTSHVMNGGYRITDPFTMS